MKDVIQHKSKNSNGISIFNPKIESYLTILKTLASEGIPKEKISKRVFKV